MSPAKNKEPTKNKDSMRTTQEDDKGLKTIRKTYPDLHRIPQMSQGFLSLRSPNAEDTKKFSQETMLAGQIIWGGGVS